MTPPAQHADTTAHSAPPLPDIARHIWETRYRKSGGRERDADLDATRRRVAMALAAAERPGAAGSSQRDEVAQRFAEILSEGRFLPGGRILAGAGNMSSGLEPAFAFTLRREIRAEASAPRGRRGAPGQPEGPRAAGFRNVTTCESGAFLVEQLPSPTPASRSASCSRLMVST